MTTTIDDTCPKCKRTRHDWDCAEDDCPMAAEGPITSFKGEYRWLSNFHLVPITMNGIVFPSTENAYQAMKSTDEAVQRLFVDMTPREAKRYSRTMDVRSDWPRMKLAIMTIVTGQKYRDPDCRRLLLATGNRELIEGNTWGDTFWGQCPLGVGENHLGKIIMARRAAIRRFE